MAVELCALFDDQRGRGDLAFDVRGATEHELFRGANVALDGPVYLRDRDIDDGFGHFSTGADDKRSVLRRDVPREVSIDSQHRFEPHFPRKIHHVADKPEPIVFINIRSVAVDEFRLAAFFSARNCWSSHWLLPFIYLFC